MSSSTPGFRMEERRAQDLRRLPAGSYLVHATNCLGSWGAGVAREISEVFPGAYARYRGFCMGPEHSGPGGHQQQHASRDLAGRCLIIPPQREDYAGAGAPEVSVVCLFTSYGYGRRTPAKPGRDPKGLIRVQTARALSHFRSQLCGEEPEDDNGSSGEEGEGEARSGRKRPGDGLAIYSPKFNSGFFRVPWEETVGQIREAFEGCEGTWTVLTL